MSISDEEILKLLRTPQTVGSASKNTGTGIRTMRKKIDKLRKKGKLKEVIDFKDMRFKKFITNQ